MDATSRLAGLLIWSGGADRRELREDYERSTHAVAGAVVLLGAVLAWVVSSLAVSESARWPVLAVALLTIVFGLLVGAVTRGTASGPTRSWTGVAGRAAVAAAVGVVVGELAALVMLAGPIDHRLDDRALHDADSAPSVAQARASLQQTRDARSALDDAVEHARERQDKALVVARCEYNPTPGCPQTRITGVPGTGAETQTANQDLADAQHELDLALAARDSQAPGLDDRLSHQRQTLDDARQGVVANAGHGFGARWVAMNGLALADPGALMLRLSTIAFCVLVYLLPLILALWRGETTHDRLAAARAQRDRANVDADTAIAVKRAEVRREAEVLWAEHQLTQARLAIEAQAEIDREQQRRRVLEAFEDPVRASPRRTLEPAEDMYLPIAAEAEAASRAISEVPAAPEEARAEAPERLPAQVLRATEVAPREQRAAPVIPSIPDATKAAARWIRPLVPPLVGRVIDNTTAPLRAARQVFEEVFEDVEEITFSLKRTRRVTVNIQSAEAADPPPSQPAGGEEPTRTGRTVSSRGGEAAGRSALGPAGPDRAELVRRAGRHELRASEGRRQLPPAQ